MSPSVDSARMKAQMFANVGVVRSLFLFLVLVPILAAAPRLSGAGAPPPVEIAGIRLGANISEYADRVHSDSAERDFSRPYLDTVRLLPPAGFRGGYLDYGDCAHKGRVARIKLTYADGSLEFFNRLLAALKARHGEPLEWRGNPFGTLRTWKWGFKTPEGRELSLIIMHYAGDDGAYTEGNSIRLADRTAIAEEEACLRAKGGLPVGGKSFRQSGEVKDFEWFLPK